METMVPQRVIDRTLADVTHDPLTGCLISNRRGVGVYGEYAQIGWREDGKPHRMYVHRVAWIAAHGPIPAGMTVDHLCFQAKCVNVDHLRLLTNFENARRQRGAAFPLGACRNGHPNSMLRVNNAGKRYCPACRSLKIAEREMRERSTCIDCGGPCARRAIRCRNCQHINQRNH